METIKAQGIKTERLRGYGKSLEDGNWDELL